MTVIVGEELLSHFNRYAINVDRVKDIPCDYWGIMGVPITYMDKHHPEMFEIVGSLRPRINGKELYWRILIRRKMDAGTEKRAAVVKALVASGELKKGFGGVSTVDIKHVVKGIRVQV